MQSSKQALAGTKKNLEDAFQESPHRSAMSSHELARFIEFAAHLEEETQASLALRSNTREMRIMLQLMRSYLRGQLETPSSLIAASGLPRGTAHRLILDMLEQGQIVKRPRTKSGKTFSLHPSEKLVCSWIEYARRMKAMLGSLFGLADGSEYFFGASYMSASIIPPLPIMKEPLPLKGDLRILMHSDPTFLAMHTLKRQFEMHFGVDVDGRALTIDRLHREILDNAERSASRYDIVTCDLCWMTEMAESGAIGSLDELLEQEPLDIMDFHPEAVAASRYRNMLYGVPVQTTPELLIYRTDIFAKEGISPPRTLDELVGAARHLHKPIEQISGLAWNGARGTPVGTTFIMVMADFGQPVLNLPRRGDGFANDDLSSDRYRPMLDSEQALQAAEFLLECLDYSPPNVLQMSWYERAKCYADGHAAMAYCYTQIMPLFEHRPDSPAHGKTGYLPHPPARDLPSIAPLGGWSLCMPSNLAPERRRATIKAIGTLTSAAATKLYMENGSVVSSRFSVCNDPHVAELGPMIPIVDKMARDGVIRMWPRPAVAELPDIVAILGDEIHTMLQRSKRPRTALADAQNRCDRMMRAHGRY